MKVLVVGRGWTGKKVYKELLSRKIDTNLASSNEALTAIKFVKYDWVVNCAGVTGVPNVDACEDDPENTMQGNAVFPVLLHRAVEASGARFMHWSSGCIYQGQIESVWAHPNFFGSIYSISKGVSDRYLTDKAVVIRIRMPFSSVDEPKNIITKILYYAGKGALYNAGQNSMTDHDEAVRVSVDLLVENAVNGPYNLVNTGTFDMYDISKMLNIENVRWRTTDEFLASIKCQRSTCQIPSYNSMRPLKQAFDEALRKCYW
jgi:dTDP-4-dehydrorhamnose reductase